MSVDGNEPNSCAPAERNVECYLVEQARQRAVKNLERKAIQLGFHLIAHAA